MSNNILDKYTQYNELMNSEAAKKFPNEIYTSRIQILTVQLFK